MAQQSQVTTNLRLRRSFGKIKKIIDIPNLIEIQKRSYDEFLQADVGSEERKDERFAGGFQVGLSDQGFQRDRLAGIRQLRIGHPKYDVEECHQRGMTFAAPIKVKIQLVIWDVESGHRSIKNVKEQEVYFGEIPLMTPNGTFMVNGTERVIVSQLHRSPGVFFEHDKGRTHSTGKLLVFGANNPLPRKLDRFRIRSARRALRAHRSAAQVSRDRAAARAGHDHRGPAQLLLQEGRLILDGKQLAKQFMPDQLLGSRVSREVKDPKTGEVLAREGRKFNKAIVRQMEQAKIERDADRDRRGASGASRPTTWSTPPPAKIAGAHQRGADRREDRAVASTRGVKRIEVLYTEDQPGGGPLRLTLLQDKLGRPRRRHHRNLRRLRPGDPPTHGDRDRVLQ